MRVLVVNAGSSSLKLRLLGADNTVFFSKDLPAHRGGFDPDSVAAAVATLADRVDAVGHRVVHGGTEFTDAVLIDAAVEQELRRLTDLAPLHQPKSLAGIDIVRRLLPDVPAVACFDTAFHTTMPEVATTYAIPEEWRELGVRRYGFHGLSHAYASRRAAEILRRSVDDVRVVTCHLGAGASLAAVRFGVSVDTTMGFTPLEGLVMATRSGTVDPGLVPWLLQHTGMSFSQVADTLEYASGLTALAGTADMAQAEADAARGEVRSRLAIGVYTHRLRAAIASMASAMDGVDVLVFTGGVGEHSSTIRSDAVAGLGFLGAQIDRHANASVVPDADITGSDSRVRIVVIEAREDLQIAMEVRSLLGARGATSER